MCGTEQCANLPSPAALCVSEGRDIPRQNENDSVDTAVSHTPASVSERDTKEIISLLFFFFFLRWTELSQPKPQKFLTPSYKKKRNNRRCKQQKHA